MDSILPPIYKCSNTFGTVPSETLTVNIIITRTFLCFLSFRTRSKYLSIFFTFLYFHSLIQQNELEDKFSFFRSGFMAEFTSSIYISKSKKILCVSFSWRNYGLCIYHLVLWSNFNLSQFPVDHLFHPVGPSLVLFQFYIAAFIYFVIILSISLST